MPDELMDAVHEAVVAHGYKDLSISKIAEKYSKGKSNIYHYYDGKEDLMLAFLDHLNQCMENEICIECENAMEELDSLLETLLGIEDNRYWEFRKAILEMKSEAPYKQAFSEKISEIDAAMKERIKEKLEEVKVEQADRKADMMLSAIEGTVNRKLTRQKEVPLEQKKQEIKKMKDLDL